MKLAVKLALCEPRPVPEGFTQEIVGSENFYFVSVHDHVDRRRHTIPMLRVQHVVGTKWTVIGEGLDHKAARDLVRKHYEENYL